MHQSNQICKTTDGKTGLRAVTKEKALLAYDIILSDLIDRHILINQQCEFCIFGSMYFISSRVSLVGDMNNSFLTNVNGVTP